MPRKRVIVRREIASDPRYNSVLVAKFVSCLLRKGKKSTAQAILYGAFDLIKQKTKEDPSLSSRRPFPTSSLWWR
jgi:small subunit ribosomal protein S7